MKLQKHLSLSHICRQNRISSSASATSQFVMASAVDVTHHWSSSLLKAFHCCMNDISEKWPYFIIWVGNYNIVKNKSFLVSQSAHQAQPNRKSRQSFYLFLPIKFKQSFQCRFNASAYWTWNISGTHVVALSYLYGHIHQILYDIKSCICQQRTWSP